MARTSITLSFLLLAAGGANAAEPCPPDLRMDGAARTISLDGGNMSSKEYKRMKWAPGHHRPVDNTFVRPAAQAVDAVIAIETRHPELVPTPFRAQVAAAPRDVALRLRMARCEIKESTTRRRGIYDALLAYLIARDPATAKEADRILDGASRHDQDSDRLSPEEADIEDALSHAALAPALKLKSPLADVGGMLVAGRLVHRCGAQLCTFVQLEGKRTPVRSDVRDHGYGDEIVLSAAEKREVCRRDTGHANRGQCEAACHVRAVQRYRANSAAAGVGDEEEERCKSECERACP